MDKFGEVSVKATCLLISKEVSDPLEAWRAAAHALLSHSSSMMTKSCPRDAYLGLCEAGLVKGASRGPWLRLDINKRNAVGAVQELRIDGIWLERPMMHLRRRVSRSKTKNHNSQINVVFALCKKGLITQEPIPEETSN